MFDPDKEIQITELKKLMAPLPEEHQKQIFKRYLIPIGDFTTLSRPERIHMLEELYNRKEGTDAWSAHKAEELSKPAPSKPPAVAWSYQHVPDFITRAVGAASANGAIGTASTPQSNIPAAQSNHINQLHSPQGTATPIEDRQSQSDRNVNKMDFKTELANLKAGGNFFKPSSGSTKIKFLDNGGDKYMKDFGDGKEKERIDFKVEVNGEEQTWSIGTGGKNSLYGQIIKLGAHFGHLDGEIITLLKKGDGLETDYTVVESVSIPDESGAKQSQLKK